MNRRWLHKERPDASLVESLSRELNVNQTLTSILIQRGISNFEEARHFFRPSMEDLHNPFLMKDMEAAVRRLHQAITGKERILVYGDYDVDGTTAVALVYSYLKSIQADCEFYIPDRSREGYGVSRAGVQWAVENGFSLIIALDLGIKAGDMVSLAGKQGIDFIICDHHLPDEKIPHAVAVLDPKQENCAYPYQELSGCGIGFKFMQAYASRFGNPEAVNAYLDLVAVSIASDIVPVTGENRVLAFHGIKKLNSQAVPGLQALMDLAGIKNEIDIGGIVFTLGPRINAAGRVSHARAAVALLIARNIEEARALAESLNLENDTRREFDLSITEEALAMIESSEVLKNARSTVLYKDTWHKGVIGIVASRCIERYYRPTIILTSSNDKITGSARSVAGFDLYSAIHQCGDLLEKFGGHKYAAGLTLEPANLDAFKSRFEEVVSSTITDEMLTPLIEIDAFLQFDQITPRFVSILKQMAPFGPENQKPVFEATGLHVANYLTAFKDRHVRFLAGQSGNDQVWQAIGFDMIEHYQKLSEGKPFRMTFTIEENHFNGTTSLQLRMKDIKFE